jgi:hypothetical protein
LEIFIGWEEGPDCQGIEYSKCDQEQDTQRHGRVNDMLDNFEGLEVPSSASFVSSLTFVEACHIADSFMGKIRVHGMVSPY